MMVAGPFEKDYWREWAEWHQHLGFDDVWIVTNNWSLPDDKPDYVHTERLDGPVPQLRAYNMFCWTHLNDYDWVMVLDGDEFLQVSRPLDYYFKRGEEMRVSQICFQWLYFGDGGEGVPTSGSVIQRFKRSAGVFNTWVKSAVSLKWYRENNQITMWLHPHFVCTPTLRLPSLHFPSEKLMSGPENLEYSGKPVTKDMPYVAHYFTKTKKEWDERRSIPRPDIGKRRDESEFYKDNHNEVEWTQLAEIQSQFK